MFDSVRPHRRQPTRLPRPWDSPGKNTGAGCHFLLQCMKVKSESEVAQSCLSLRDPMDCSLPGSSVHGIFQARGLEWGAIAFSKFRVGWRIRNDYWDWGFLLEWWKYSGTVVVMVLPTLLTKCHVCQTLYHMQLKFKSCYCQKFHEHGTRGYSHTADEA